MVCGRERHMVFHRMPLTFHVALLKGALRRWGKLSRMGRRLPLASSQGLDHPLSAERMNRFMSTKRVSAMLTSEIKEAIARAELFPFATASAAGIPNVVPIKYLHVAGDDALWITDNYMQKSLANLRENPQAAIYVWSPEPKLCVQLKGDAEIRTEGEEYEQMKALVRRVKADLPARSLVIVRVREIYQCLPGTDVGRKIWPSS